MRIRESIQYINKWLSENANPIEHSFNGPAEANEIAQLEQDLGIIFPKSVRDAYLLHNGEVDTSDGVFGCWKWLSLSEVRKHYNELSEFNNSPPIIPILDGSGDFYYVESAKIADDESEVIEWWHENPTRNIKSSSFESFLSDFVVELKLGQYIFIPDELNALVDKDDL